MFIQNPTVGTFTLKKSGYTYIINNNTTNNGVTYIPDGVTTIEELNRMFSQEMYLVPTTVTAPKSNLPTEFTVLQPNTLYLINQVSMQTPSIYVEKGSTITTYTSNASVTPATLASMITVGTNLAGVTGFPVMGRFFAFTETGSGEVNIKSINCTQVSTIS